MSVFTIPHRVAADRHTNLPQEPLFFKRADNDIVAQVKRIKAANEARDVRREA